MAWICSDAEGILLINYHPKGKTKTGEYYANVLNRPDQSNREKALSLSKKRSVSIKIIYVPIYVLYPWQNSLNCSTTCCTIQSIPQSWLPPISAFTTKIQKTFGDKRFSSNGKWVATQNQYFEDLEKISSFPRMYNDLITPLTPVHVSLYLFCLWIPFWLVHSSFSFFFGQRGDYSTKGKYVSILHYLHPLRSVDDQAIKCLCIKKVPNTF